MQTPFKIRAIQEDFSHLFEMTEKELLHIGAKCMIADSKPGYPCRISLEDAHLNDTVIAFNYEHHKANTPYKSSGPIFIRKHAKKAALKTNEIPLMLHHRLLSLRAYNVEGIMINASTVSGKDLEPEIQHIFSNKKAHYIHIHNAGPGCYNCQVDRL